MARKLSPAQQRELSAFVERLAAQAGYETTADWARDADYPAPNLSNLRNGKSAIDGYNLLRLITAAAARVEAEPDDLVISEVQKSIDQRLDELADGVGEILEILRAAAEAPGEGGQSPAKPR